MELVAYAAAMLARVYRPGFAYAKAGVMVRDIVPCGGIPERTLFGAETSARAGLMRTIDELRRTHGAAYRRASHTATDRYGQVAQDRAPVVTAAELLSRERAVVWHARHERLSPHYTTKWDAVPHVLLPRIVD
jgi:DNA polymerase V